MIFGALVFLVLLLDQITKLLAVHFLSGVDTVPVLQNVFHLTLVYNTGIAFGFFRNSQGLLLGAISLCLVFILIWGAKSFKNSSKDPAQKLQSFALALILGGAIGNWIDRVRVGSVIDFLDFRIWPVFNLADSAITVGVCYYLLLLLKEPAKKTK